MIFMTFYYTFFVLRTRWVTDCLTDTIYLQFALCGYICTLLIHVNKGIFAGEWKHTPSSTASLQNDMPFAATDGMSAAENGSVLVLQFSFNNSCRFSASHSSNGNGFDKKSQFVSYSRNKTYVELLHEKKKIIW